jgi:hypothetical protein
MLQSTETGRTRRTAFAAFAILGLATSLALMLLDPLPQPLQSVVVLTISMGLVAMGAARWRESRDEVAKEAHKFASRWGAPIGFFAAIGLVFAVRYSPGLQQAFADFAENANPNAPAATVAFALGVVATGACVMLASGLVWLAWWLAKR